LAINRIIRQAKQSFTWIYRACLNTAMTWQRSEKRRHRFLNSAVSGAIFLLEVFLRRRFHPASDFFSFIHF
jgi:hypothetical protein